MTCWKCRGTGAYRVSAWNEDDAIRETVSRDCDCVAAKKEAKTCLILSGDGRTIKGQPGLVCREFAGPTTHE